MGAEAHKDSSLLNDRGGRGVAVLGDAELRLLDIEDKDVMDLLAGLQVETERPELVSIGQGVGDPDLFFPDDRRGPGFAGQGNLPGDALALGKLERKRPLGFSIASRTSELIPIVCLCRNGKGKKE